MQLKNKFLLIAFLILIFILTLGITQKVFAEKFPNFSTDKTLFCLNRGYSFSKTANYSLIAECNVDGQTIGASWNTIDPKDLLLDPDEDKANYYKLAYILSESEGYRKTSIGGSAVQVAIWCMLGQTNYPVSSNGYTGSGKALKAYADAYAEFIVKDKGLKLEKIENKFGIHSDGYIGPFKLTYTKITNGDYSYGNIKKITLTGNNDTELSFEIYIEDTTNGSFEKISRMPTSSEEFYIKFTSENLQITECTLNVKQEGKRKANFQVWHYGSKGGVGAKIGEIIYYFQKENSTTFFCQRCMDYHNVKFETGKNFCVDCGVAFADGDSAHAPCKQWISKYDLPNAQVFYGRRHCDFIIAQSGGRDLVAKYGTQRAPMNPEGSRYLDISFNTKYQNLLEFTGNGGHVHNKADITFTLLPQLELNLTKKNTIGQELIGDSTTGAEFSIKAMQTNAEIYNESLNIPVVASIMPKNTDDITVTISELKPPAGHLKLPTSISIIYEYDEEAVAWIVKSITDWTLTNGFYKNGDDKFEMTANIESTSATHYDIAIYNRPKVNFEFIKTDEISNDVIKGVLFNVAIQNCLAGPSNITSIDDIANFDIYTDENGKINLDDLEFEINEALTGYKDIIITLTEKEVPKDSNGLPTYRLLKGPITITISYTVENGVATISATTTHSEDEGNVTEEIVLDEQHNYILKLNVKNEPLIHLGGKVWLDVPQGSKPVLKPDGTMQTNEAGIEAVPIYLFKTEDNGQTFQRVIKDTYGTNLITQTSKEINEKGKYLYANLPKIANGYYLIYYSYDGVNYIATVAGNDQKASENINIGSENIRTSFNGRFATITKDIKVEKYFNIDTLNTTIEESNIITENTFTTAQALQYNTYDSGNNRYKSHLITVNETGRTPKVISQYVIYSKTNQGHNETNININFGLQKREMDISLMKDLFAAEVKVNGKTTIYSYDDIIATGGILELNQEGNYGTTVDTRGGVFLNPEGEYYLNQDGTKQYLPNSYFLRSNLSPVTMDIIGDDTSFGKTDYKLNLYKSDVNTEGTEIYLYYAIGLNNQGMINLYENGTTVTINKIADYYDSKFELIAMSYDTVNWIDLGDSLQRVTIDNNSYKKVILDCESAGSLAEGERKMIYLKFKVPVIALNSLGNLGTNEFGNIAEIISYSTKCGLVDKDSAPENALYQISRGQYELRNEDDTDKAENIEIEIPEGKEREITGNVWEDIKTKTNGAYKYGNGAVDTNENGIKGITVELYEEKVGARSKLVGTTTTDEEGNYSFRGFIPGNYKIIFKYKDETYNGQNYKSGTVSEAHYAAAIASEEAYIYNHLYTLNGKNARGRVISKAIDNPKTRLQLIAKYAETTKTNHPIYNEAEEMQATTPQINISVDVNPQNFSDTEGSTNVYWGDVQNLKVENVSLAIEKRPETKLTIEEHIKRVSLRGNDKAVLAQAEVDRENDLFNNTLSADMTTGLTGQKDGIRAIKTTKESIGSWEIITDIGEVIQGSELETEVVYQINNESEEDYLSKTVVENFKNNKISDYIEYIKNIITQNNRTLTAMIGKTYFTGIIDQTVEKVPTKIGNIQDYINDLEFRSSSSFNKVDTDSNKYKIATKQISLGDMNNIQNNYKILIKLQNKNLILQHKTEEKILTAIWDEEDQKYYSASTEYKNIKGIIQTKEEIGLLLPGASKKRNRSSFRNKWINTNRKTRL